MVCRNRDLLSALTGGSDREEAKVQGQQNPSRNDENPVATMITRSSSGCRSFYCYYSLEPRESLDRAQGIL